jgi:hypothetical protein
MEDPVITLDPVADPDGGPPIVGISIDDTFVGTVLWPDEAEPF